MLSLLNSVDSTFRDFFNQLTDALGYGGFLGIVLGVEGFFILLFIIATAFSYEARLKRSLDRCNKWLFKYKKIDMDNIKDFNKTIKKGPKRLVYYWQQFILYRDGGPSVYLSEENIIEKPLKTSSWQSNIKNLGLVTVIWSIVALILGIASQEIIWSSEALALAAALVMPCLTALLGVIGIILLKGRRVMNLDDIYHIYHFFTRFLSSATADLTPYIDFNLLFTNKEIENGNPQLREYYEARARKTKEEFEKAQKNDIPLQNYQFENVGVDGGLLLDRAMKESETFINKKNSVLAQIAQIESQKEALKRNYENVQMDLQRKIQASKENIEKLIEQQTTTTSRIEVRLLTNQQQKEVNKRAQLQKDYDQEEQRYLQARSELDAEVVELNKQLEIGLEEVQKAMGSEYQTFFEKVMKSAYAVAEQKVKDEKRDIATARDKNEQELVIVQTQIKRLKDENDTLRERLSKYDPNYKEEKTQDEQGHYDEQGNYIYSDGSYHDTNGLFHDIDGKVYNMNGELVSYDVSPEQQAEIDKEQLKNQQIQSFGSFVSEDGEKQVAVAEEEQEELPPQDSTLDEQPVEEIAPYEPEENNSLQNEENSAIVESEPEQETVSEDNLQAIEEIPEETEAIEEPIVQEEKLKKKRGRPKKSETEQSAPQKKRGRPRKSEEVKEPVTTKKRGRPRKTENLSSAQASTSKKTPKTTAKKSTEKTKTQTKKTTNKKPKQTNTATGKRGRPRKVASQEVKPKAKRGRPRKETLDSDLLNKINDLINKEENKLQNIKAFFNTEMDQALEPQNQNYINQEKDDIMNDVEALKVQANKAKSSGQSEELAKINKRIEDLIKELSSINSDGDNSDSNAQ